MSHFSVLVALVVCTHGHFRRDVNITIDDGVSASVTAAGHIKTERLYMHDAEPDAFDMGSSEEVARSYQHRARERRRLQARARARKREEGEEAKRSRTDQFDTRFLQDLHTAQESQSCDSPTFRPFVDFAYKRLLGHTPHISSF